MDTIDTKLPAHQEVDLDTLRGDVMDLELRVRVLRDSKFSLMGDKYGLELKLEGLKDVNHHLRSDLIALREIHSKVCNDLFDITLEKDRLNHKVDKFRAMILSCESSDICKSYRQHYLSDGTDTVDGASV